MTPVHCTLLSAQRLSLCVVTRHQIDVTRDENKEPERPLPALRILQRDVITLHYYYHYYYASIIKVSLSRKKLQEHCTSVNVTEKTAQRRSSTGWVRQGKQRKDVSSADAWRCRVSVTQWRWMASIAFFQSTTHTHTHTHTPLDNAMRWHQATLTSLARPGQVRTQDTNEEG